MGARLSLAGVSGKASQPNRSMNRVRVALVLVIGLALGWFLWWLAPFIVGPVHPLDSPLPYYYVALVASGFVAALAYPRYFWVAAVGVCLGQLGYIATHTGQSALWLAGLVIAAAYSVLALVGALGALALVLAIQGLIALAKKDPKRCQDDF